MQALAPLVDDVIVVVNGQLHDDDINTLETYVRVLTRDNKGYDTAAFREGIFAFGKDTLKDYDQLLLVNDTNIGPMRDLSQVFHEMADKQLDFWGFPLEKNKRMLLKRILTVTFLSIFSLIS